MQSSQFPASGQVDRQKKILPSGGHGYPSLDPGMAPVELLNFLLLGSVVHLLLHPIPDLGQCVLTHRKVPAPLPVTRVVFQQMSVQCSMNVLQVASEHIPLLWKCNLKTASSPFHLVRWVQQYNSKTSRMTTSKITRPLQGGSMLQQKLVVGPGGKEGGACWLGIRSERMCFQVERVSLGYKTSNIATAQADNRHAALKFVLSKHLPSSRHDRHFRGINTRLLHLESPTHHIRCGMALAGRLLHLLMPLDII